MKKLIVPIIIFVVCLIMLVFSGFNLVLWYIDNQDISSEVDLVQDITPVKVITIADEKNSSKETQYITADLGEIQKLNKEVKGWINIPFTNVNYPYVQHKDNSYYLNHSFDKSKNKAGWLFMDYRNNALELDDNTIIYGHNRLDGSMFGSLNNLTKKNYLNDTTEHIIYLSTDNYNYVFEIFSIYRIETTDDYLKTTFKDHEFADWLSLVKKRSMYNFDVEVDESDKVITLSTCYKHVKKLVIHGKLIRQQLK
ncbi:MAG: class B sortase [Bacilli bacterium]|nr:class B sortase [Bacilli bacterium]